MSKNHLTSVIAAAVIAGFILGGLGITTAQERSRARSRQATPAQTQEQQSAEAAPPYASDYTELFPGADTGNNSAWTPPAARGSDVAPRVGRSSAGKTDPPRSPSSSPPPANAKPAPSPAPVAPTPSPKPAPGFGQGGWGSGLPFGGGMGGPGVGGIFGGGK